MTYTDAEYNLLYHPRGNRAFRELRDGFTSEQAIRMFERRDASEKAASTTFADSASVKEAIDKLITDGFTYIEQVGRWMRLGNSEQQWSFGDKVSHDYVRVALNLGEFKRNY